MLLSSCTTWRGVVRSARESPEPSTTLGVIPNGLTASRTTAPPADVLPAPPNCAPRPLISISAM